MIHKVLDEEIRLLYELLESLFCSQEISKRKLKLSVLDVRREFELEHQNGRWMEAPGCQRITLSHCDLTSDLGSDSDYNIRVRAHCGSQRSAWTKLSLPFNRRQSKTRADSSVCFTADVRCVYGCLSSAETYRQAGRESQALKERKRPWF